MSDRGPSGQDPDPTEFFPPFASQDPPSGADDLPPIGSERDSDPTQVVPSSTPTGGQYPPTTAMAPAGGGPYEPGPPYGGDPGDPGGPGGPGGPGDPYGDEPEFNPEPVPWYRQPGPVAALIAGIAALVLGVIALIVWTGGDDDTSDDTLPPPGSTSTTTEPSTTITTSPPTTTSTTAPETTASTSTTTLPPTTTTLPPTTTTPPTAPPTTAAPPATTTTTTTVPVTAPPGSTVWGIIQSNSSLSTLEALVACSDTESDFDTPDPVTILAPTDLAFEEAGIGEDSCDDPDLLESVLLLLVIPNAELTAEEIRAAGTLTTQGGEVPVNENGTIGSNEASIIFSDVDGSNGFVQVINKVIQP